MTEKSKQFTDILDQNRPAPLTRPSKVEAGRGAHIGGYFPPAVAKQLKHLALDEDRTLTELVGEALDLLFQSRGLPTIAQPPQAKGG